MEMTAELKTASDAAAAALKPLSREQRGVVIAGLIATHIAEQAMVAAEGAITFDQTRILAGLSSMFLDASETVAQATDLLTRAAARIVADAATNADPVQQ